MPNWCFTDYVITGDESEISDLFEKLSSLPNREDVTENDFGKFWLGNVIALFGGDYQKIRCRGNMNNLERMSPTEISFNTETAWGDMPTVWDFVLSRYPSLKYYYYAEECGCCYYATNDKEGKYFHDRYIVEQWENPGREKFQTLEEALEEVSKRIGQPISSWDELTAKIKAYNEANEDNRIYVNKIAVGDPEDMCKEK